jgi:hypothetical protein
MSIRSLADLANELRTTTKLVRTGVVLVPPTALRQVKDAAYRAGLDVVDYVTWKLERLAPGQRSVPLNVDSFLGDLDEIANGNSVSGCILIANADVPLARLRMDERQSVWDFLLNSFKRRRQAIVLAIPRGADHLFPQKHEEQWTRVGRVAAIERTGDRGCVDADDR